MRAAATRPLASLALSICIIGLVDMAGHTTGRRRREIGVRKTLGATWQSVLGLLLGLLPFAAAPPRKVIR